MSTISEVLRDLIINTNAVATWPRVCIPKEGEEYEAIVVDKETEEFQRVEEVLSGMPKSGLLKVFKICNPYLFGRYELKKEEYKQRDVCFEEKVLFHSTAMRNDVGIIEDNIDWRKSKNKRMISFANNANYADKLSDKIASPNKLLVICRVIVGDHTYDGPNIQKQDHPEEDYYLKCVDDEYYPHYICYYICK